MILKTLFARLTKWLYRKDYDEAIRVLTTECNVKTNPESILVDDIRDNHRRAVDVLTHLLFVLGYSDVVQEFGYRANTNLLKTDKHAVVMRDVYKRRMLEELRKRTDLLKAFETKKDTNNES